MIARGLPIYIGGSLRSNLHRKIHRGLSGLDPMRQSSGSLSHDTGRLREIVRDVFVHGQFAVALIPLGLSEVFRPEE